MDIETPISETDEDTLFAEQIKHNGLVLAPGKYEVNNGYYLKADGTWDLPKRGNNNFISVVTPREEMTSQVSSTVGITFVTFDYSKIIESLSLAVNTGSGFEGILIINTKLFGEILINFSVNLFNLNGNVNKNATAYANIGTKSTGHDSQISIIQNTYGADIKTPVFIYNDSVNNICKIGLYGTASKSPVIIKDCTLNQTYTDFDVNDITITWEPTTITISEENTNDAHLFTNMDWSKTFTPIANMTDPDGSYSENNVRRWKLQNNGLVPAPTKYEADEDYVLHADGTWKKVDGKASFTPVPITLDSTKYQEAYETQSNPDSSKKTVLFMNIDLSDLYTAGSGSDVAKIELSLYSIIYGRSTLVIDTMINSISNQYCVSEDANGSGYYLDYLLSALRMNPSFTGKDGVSIESLYTFMIDGNIIRIGISPIIFSLYGGTVPPFVTIVIEDCKIIRQSLTSNSVTTEMGSISINYDQTTNTLSNIYGANRKGWVAKNIVFSDYNDADPRDFQSLHNGLVPAPTREEAGENKFLKADGSWSEVTGILYKSSVMLTGSSYSEYVRIAQITSGNKNNANATLRFRVALGGNSISVTVQFDSNGSISTGLTSMYLTEPDSYKLYSTKVSLEENNEYMAYLYYDSGSKKYDICINSILLSILNGLALNKMTYLIDDYKINGEDTDIDIDWTTEIIDAKPSGVYSKEITSSTPDQFFTSHPDSYNDLLAYTYRGLVPSPSETEVEQGKFLKADGTWGYQKKPLNDMLATVSPSDENIEAYNAAKETKRISFVTIDFTNVMNKVSSGMWSGKLHFDVSENNFGTTHLYLQFIVNKTMCNVNIFSTLGTNPVDNNSSAISNLMDYGVETSSPIFVTNEGDSKNIIRIGFNGVSATRNISILDCYIDSPYDITIDDLVISWESSIIDTTLVNKYINSKVISYMDSGDIFSSISNITSPSMIESTNAKTLKMYKLMNNGFVPAPYQYEADQRYVLYADGTWGPIEGIIRNRTFTVTPYTDSSSTQTNDYVITEGAEDLAIAINENYSVDINIVFSGLGSKNNTNTTLIITGVTGTVNLYDYSGNPIKYITDGMSMKCTIFKNTIDDPVESMNAYCIYDIISYPDTINGPSE